MSLTERDARARRAGIALAALVTIAAPLVRELYPLSSPTMFAYPLRQRARYELRAPDGRRLRLEDFELQLNNPHDPPVTTLGRHGYGRRSPPSVHDPGRVLSMDALRQHLARQLARRPALAYVDVTQRLIGPVDDRRVGELRRARLRVHNPAWRGDDG